MTSNPFKNHPAGLNIHFIRVTPKVPATIKVYPLLILHGWPGSVKEFQGIIPLLTTPRKDKDFVFEVRIYWPLFFSRSKRYYVLPLFFNRLN
jgi:Epoxide hydrolase N terminus.